jgi:probable rRNA maturation factor
MNRSLFIRNQQQAHALNVRYLRRMTRELLHELLWIDAFDLCIYIVRAPKMAVINRTFLQHEGSTDVITFDYQEAETPKPKDETRLHGELFICIDEAFVQAKRFRTTWQSELVRYVIHGILHLCGYDDLTPADRSIMKREENRLLKKLQLALPSQKLATPTRNVQKT